MLLCKQCGPSCRPLKHKALEECRSVDYVPYLLCSQSFPIVLQEVPHDDRAHNSESLSCLELGGKGEEAGVFDV